MNVLPIAFSLLATSVAASPINALSDATSTNPTGDSTKCTTGRYCGAPNMGGECMNMTWWDDREPQCGK
ncbi:hypothetical protein PG985_012964 [Apiospora marii]|uniref:uncharacterized protein n=1 Tax=Apiospora marii TaxID=335849 RepID=UPI00312DD110